MPYKPNEREYRSFQVLDTVPEEDGKMIVRGYASTYQPYKLLETDKEIIVEQIMPGSFDFIDFSDTIFQYDHAGHVLARTKNNTLHCHSDERGLYIEADLSGTELGRQLYHEIKGGYVDKMSFGFTIEKDEWEDGGKEADGRNIYKRTIRSFKKIYDVSAVSIPANPDTEIALRNSFNGSIEGVRQELEKRNALSLAKKKAILKAKIIKGGINNDD